MIDRKRSRYWRWIQVALRVAAIAVAASRTVVGDEPRAGPSAARPQEYNPLVAPASDSAQRAMRSFSLPKGLAVELFAAEPLLANPVAFCVDEKGVFYVAETFRHGTGVTDTRDHMNWLDADLASRTVADRVAMYKKYLGTGYEAFLVDHERVRRVVDQDGDGRADSATVFADGFNDPAAGIGAGVLASKGDVWFACVPWLWKLRDTKQRGQADERVLLHEGYGVHVGFLGHDLHGLRFGPDGKLYFSMGDRGFNVKTREGDQLAVPDTGSVLRSNPDGTELEVFATGLRNPQELVFDQYGNLFTCDNNSDSGDRARVVHVVEGGDSGWRIGYQFIETPISRGPWNEEKLWHPAFDGQAAYIIPPIANLADGPSGLAYEPGTSLLPEAYRNRFFLVDFRGSSGQSGIRSFALEPKGASFELVDSRRFVWSVLATDVDFGPDGALYFCDWVEGWSKPNRGRIYRVIDPARRGDARVREVKTVLAQGMEARSLDELAALLSHPDMRVRQEAQFALAARGEDATRRLAQVASARQSPRLARLHAIWGLAQAARSDKGRVRQSLRSTLEPLLYDSDAEVRAQTAKVLGEARESRALDRLVDLLADPSPRVRFFGAMALGKLGRAEAIVPLLELLRASGDKDAYVRHAAVMGLVGSGASAAWKRAAHDPSRAVRLGALLALRRTGDPAVARLLKDSDPRIVLEAARAIYDVPVEAALPQLAALPVTSNTPMPLVRRILNANFRLGDQENAARVVTLTGEPGVSREARVQALELLAEWGKPAGRDRITGLWRPIPERSSEPAAAALRPRLASILTVTSETVRTKAAIAAAALGIKEAGPHLFALATDADQTDRTRAAALAALDELQDARRLDAARKALALPGSRTKTDALRILAKLQPELAISALQDRLEHGTTRERQGALAILATVSGDAACRLFVTWLDRLIAGRVPSEIQLDLFEAAAQRHEPLIRQKLERYQASKPKNDPLAQYREALAGGNAERGLTIFMSRADVACLRCHKVRLPSGEPFGGEVGPDLTGIGARKDRSYLLESMVDPSKQIAEGFDSVVLATSDGRVHTGVLRGENEKEVQLVTADGQPEIVSKDSIEDRKRGPSAMPADVVQKLSRIELRDLVEYLSGLKTPAKAP
jgi:quinoprotein glucose dehydrogenase